ncbi:DUF4435 domain-containing protein [Morganella morganii]|uniref:DUF4435 domain-containing protein n=1 Tax=Morganella morganii TaxID=582 RepID=UPI001BDB6122|nr:DUF4435 domain-containing protein [Morganella morganii]ELA8731559.1 DUF4435 domain-containing protein [Morganella morganii]ELB1851671.1 DUF4435 domain-containing protein [Morganella morganii]MBT0492110.1 DUF4435 domain-containing protein [Morganella morganii subsp. morganii]QWM07836.1 DUF4435 domain-containing protein [Morganella morganii subsp. morganii]
MLKRSVRANKAKSIFFEDYNDIDVYTEDTAAGYKKLYSKLLSRYFDGGYKIENIFPLGGRDAVLEACSKDKNKRSRPRVYIIDGDLHLLRNDIPNLPGLFTLKEYCIENTLICECATIDFLVDEEPTKEHDDIKLELNFQKWLKYNETLLIKLFINYAISMEMTPELPTVSLKINDYLNDDTGYVDAIKVESRIASRRSEIISRVGQHSYNERLSEIEHLIEGKEDKHAFISGKDYLLPLLQMRMRKVIKYSASAISLRHRLSKTCRLEIFSGLKDKILTD